MIWFFERQQRRLHYEIRRQTDGNDYEFVICHPDGRIEVERYVDSADLLQRAASLQDTLRHEGWTPPVRPRAAARPFP